MIRTAAFCATLSIDEETLEVWTASGWLEPRRVSGEPLFSDVDEARGRFIFALQRDMGINDSGIGVILDLVDQIHGLRGTMQELVEALGEQPEDIRRAIAAAAERRRG
jgi:chaperone modulatory protein CbpM